MKQLNIISILLLLQVELRAQDIVPVTQIKQTTYNTFGAVPYKNGWAYVSNENELSWASYTNQDDQPLFRIITTDSSFGHKKELTGIMSNHVNYGPLVFYAQQKKAVVTKNISAPTRQKAKLGLFFFEEQNGKWQETSVFEYNDVAYSCGHAAINEKGDTLVFASDMPGTSGGTDLFMSFLQNGKWSKPMNLKNMNSAGNEMFPFLHRDGRIFFSSDRKGGKGGLDIYTSQTAFPFQKTILMDSAINSRYDDFAYWCSTDHNKGMFASNRTGYDQLYSFTQWVPEFNNCTAWEETILCYDFYEEATMDITKMPLVYEWDFGDGSKQKKLSASHCFEKPGLYTVQLNVLDTVINKLYMNEASYELEITEAVQPALHYDFKNNQKDSIVWQAGQGTWNAYPISKMYWKTNGIVTEGNRHNMAYNESSPTDVLLLIRSADGQTNCFQRKLEIGTPQKNTIEELAETTNPEEKNESTEEEVYRVILNESAERKRIDREHFKDLYTKVSEYYYPEDSLYRYTMGEAKHPLALKPAFDSAHRAGFTQAHVETIPANVESTSDYEVSRTSLDAIDENKLDALLGNTFELPLVYFDYNKTDIKPECAAPLDLLAGYLARHPEYTLEITAHTDDKGPDKFNLDLSEKRATSVFAYLSSKGVDQKNMSRKGHGETYPKYPNTTEENRSRNRRVEFRILK